MVKVLNVFLTVALLVVSILLPTPVRAEVLGPPTNLAVTGQTVSSISLEWTAEPLADKTLILYKAWEYPASRTDTGATQCYYGTDNVCTVEGLSPGVTYYFRAWSWDNV